MAKCIQNNWLGGEIRRVSDAVATLAVKGAWEYCPKWVWKKNVRSNVAWTGNRGKKFEVNV